MNCKICQCHVDNNVEVFTAIGQLILAGDLPESAYLDVVIRMCENAGCLDEEGRC